MTLIQRPVANKNVLTIAGFRGYKGRDSRGNETVCGKLFLSDGKSVTFMVPSGASKGDFEALEKPASEAIANMNGPIAHAIEDNKISTETTQLGFDVMLTLLDGTPNLSRLGANAILAASGAFSKAKAAAEGKELWEYFADGNARLPLLSLNVLNAGKHSGSSARAHGRKVFEVQETMILPISAPSFGDAYRMGIEVRTALRSVLEANDHPVGRGDEGGFVNPFTNVEETIKAVELAIKKAGYVPGKQIGIIFDAAFSEIYGKNLWEKVADPNDHTYHFGNMRYSPEEMANFWVKVIDAHPSVVGGEDLLAQNDKVGWKLLTQEVGHKVLLILDDVICTNPGLIQEAINDNIGNASLIKPNQIGTISATLQSMSLTKVAGRSNMLSHRSGETEDTFLGAFAMHEFVDMIKCGSSGSDRLGKYNLLWLAEQEMQYRIAEGTLDPSRLSYRSWDAFPTLVRDNILKRVG